MSPVFHSSFLPQVISLPTSRPMKESTFHSSWAQRYLLTLFPVGSRDDPGFASYTVSKNFHWVWHYVWVAVGGSSFFYSLQLSSNSSLVQVQAEPPWLLLTQGSHSDRGKKTTIVTKTQWTTIEEWEPLETQDRQSWKSNCADYQSQKQLSPSTKPRASSSVGEAWGNKHHIQKHGVIILWDNPICLISISVPWTHSPNP